MSQKIIQAQTLQQTQTLSPQQILTVRLLEMPVAELEQRVKNELMENGALEEELDRHDPQDDSSTADNNEPDEDNSVNDSEIISENEQQLKQAMDDYRSPDDVPDYLLNSYNERQTPENIESGSSQSFFDQMTEQMNQAELTPKEKQLMAYLIGSLENDGLLKKKLSSIVNELEIYNNINTNEEELTNVLHKLQQFDPPGVGARDLQECLLLQIKRDEKFKTPLKQAEYKIIEKYFDEFTHKRWDKIAARMQLSEADARTMQRDLARLNPRPGSAMGETEGRNLQQITPDFIVETEDDGTITITLNQGEVPQLRVSPSFMEILQHSSTDKAKQSRSEKEALAYTKQKIEKAQGFIDAIKQRQNTLMAVMRAIVDIQRPFFLEGDESAIKPMILKDVAKRTGLDISTVSRVTNSKYVQTNYGTFQLKWFFTDSFTTGDGQEIAVRQIQNELKEIVNSEDKNNPYSDETLAAMLNDKGYPIARRTVAKYREQLGIPVARLRK